eukprot:TRINITY_DN5627_c0_g1_i1.p1 TRINITY_DN5627_c0_g1~~TRINITY_DN5627_c0_g1_i1.p1  ORF type:complete len:292 (+),score=90.62 TRINITY_DN5627_c0_g1_i1:91-966(+)
MSDDERTVEELEEERLMRAMSGRRFNPSPNLKKVVSPRGVQSNVVVSPRSRTHGRAPSTEHGVYKGKNGKIPAWKLKQIEEEEKAKKAAEEEEKRKQQYVHQLESAIQSGHSPVDQSHDAQGFHDHDHTFTTDVHESSFHIPVSETSEKLHEDEPVSGKDVFEDRDEEEEMRLEEERLMRRTGMTPRGGDSVHHHRSASSLTGNPLNDSHLAIGGQQKIDVAWVGHDGVVKAEGAFMCVDSRLPILAVENGLKVKNLVWKETGKAITNKGNGYSNLTFQGRNFVEVFGDPQ